MKITEVIVKKSFDAHICQDVVVVANKFQSEVLICKGFQKANVKSIMGVISLMLKVGDHVLIATKGKDTDAATEGMLATGLFTIV